MKRKGLALFFCLLPALLTAVLPLPEGENGIGFDISGGITLSSGNSDQTVINGGYAFAYHHNSFSYESKLEIFYGENDGVTQVSNGSWTHSLLHSLGSRLNISGSLGIEYDRVAQIGSRSNLDFGILFKLVEKEKNKTDIGATLRGEFLSGLGDTEDSKSIRLTIGLQTERIFSETANFKLSCQFIPKIDNPFRDYRLELQTSLSVLMKDPMWLTLKFRERFTSIPQNSQLKKNDLTLVAALTLSF